MRSRSSSSLTSIILLALEKTIDGYVRLEDFVINAHIYAQGYDRPLKKSMFAQAIKRLRGQGLIELNNQKKIILKLTDKGKNLAIRTKLQNDDEAEWDGKWTVVSFDIPENRRLLRDILRRRLKEWGFMKLQKSLWISKKDIASPVGEYINEIGIKNWVKVFKAEEIPI